MVDEMERLRHIIGRNAPAAPRQSIRSRTIEEAVAHFDAIQQERRQGFHLVDRLRITAKAVGKIIARKRPMKLSHALVGSVSVAALALIIINTNQMQIPATLEPKVEQGQDQQAAAPADKISPDLVQKSAAPAAPSDGKKVVETLAPARSNEFVADGRNDSVAGDDSLGAANLPLTQPASPAMSMEELAAGGGGV